MAETISGAHPKDLSRALPQSCIHVPHMQRCMQVGRNIDEEEVRYSVDVQSNAGCDCVDFR